MSFANPPSFQLSGFLACIIGRVVGKTDKMVKNSGEFVERTREVRTQADETMVSFDVDSLFTNIPGDRAVSVTLDWMKHSNDWKMACQNSQLTPEDGARLQEMCLNSSTFIYDGAHS